MTIEQWINLGVGFGGVVLGALLAWGLQRFDRWHEKRDDRRNQTIKTMFKASLVLSDVATTVEAVQRALARAEKTGLGSEPVWSRLSPIAGGSQSYSLEAEDVVPFMEAREYQLVGDYTELIMQQDGLNHLVRDYNERRIALNDIMSTDAVGDGGSLFHVATAEEQLRLAPYLLPLNDLATAIVERGPAILDAAKSVNRRIGEVGAKQFGKRFPRIDPDGKRP